MTQIVDKYDEVEFEKLWASAKTDGAIGVGTLFHYAQQNNLTVAQSLQTNVTNDDVKDIRNGRLFAESNRGRLLFFHEIDEVVVFDESGWKLASPGQVERAAKQIVADMRSEANELFKLDHNDPVAKALNKHADQSSSLQRIFAMIELARSEPGMTVRLSEFDNDPNLLGLKNGVMNLKERDLVEIQPDVYVSLRCNVDFDPLSSCPKFKQFLVDIQPDQEIRRLLQQLAGLFLSGDSNLQKLVFFYGHGANGKTTFIELMAWILGDYTRRIPTELLMQQQRNSQGPSPDIVALKGRRMVYCNEVEENRRLAEARVKELTGGDTLTGRAVYGKVDITFRPTHKLVMVGNYQPEITDMSHGMWRRMLLIPFDQTIDPEKCDDELSEKLKAEGSGILNWMLAGYHDYLTHGIVVPQSIKNATNAYKTEQDVIGEWVSDHCIIDASQSSCKRKLYKAYQFWIKDRGQHPLAQVRFTRRLTDRGYRQDAGRRNITGLALNPEGLIASTRVF